jgi:hypothetical protein
LQSCNIGNNVACVMFAIQSVLCFSCFIFLCLIFLIKMLKK